MIREISEIENGETGYVVPWSIYVAWDGTLWIRTDYSIYDKPGGIWEITLSKNNDRLTVDVNRCDYTWDHRSLSDFKFLPISNVIGKIKLRGDVVNND